MKPGADMKRHPSPSSHGANLFKIRKINKVMILSSNDMPNMEGRVLVRYVHVYL